MTKKQDSLLRKYAKSVGGVIFTEIAVGKRSSHGERRYIDGVRVIPPGAPGKVDKLHGAEFKKLVKGRTVEASARLGVTVWIPGHGYLLPVPSFSMKTGA